MSENTHFNLSTPEFFQNPYPVYAQMREEAPVYWSKELEHWIFTRHDDVFSIIKDHKHHSSRRGQTPFPEALRSLMAPFLENSVHWLVLLDQPDHTRIRNLVNKAFTPKAIDQLQPRIQNIISELLDNVEKQGSFDLIRDFSNPLPSIVIAEMLGTDPADRSKLKEWSYDIAMVLGMMADLPGLQKGQHSILTMAAYFQDLIQQRREAPGSDLISAMVVAQEQNDSLSDQEIIAQCILFFLAGHETTQNLIGNGMHALLTTPGEVEKLKNNPILIKNAIEEMLRYHAPVQAVVRVATEDMEIRGQKILKGQAMLPFIAAANRDPAIYAAPDEFHVDRQNPQSLTFGHGIHFCIGAALARMEARLAFEMLFQRFPNLALVKHEGNWVNNLFFRGLSTLPMTW